MWRGGSGNLNFSGVILWLQNPAPLCKIHKTSKNLWGVYRGPELKTCNKGKKVKDMGKQHVKNIDRKHRGKGG